MNESWCLYRLYLLMCKCIRDCSATMSNERSVPYKDCVICSFLRLWWSLSSSLHLSLALVTFPPLTVCAPVLLWTWDLQEWSRHINVFKDDKYLRTLWSEWLREGETNTNTNKEQKKWRGENWKKIIRQGILHMEDFVFNHNINSNCN
jgi:hypothetical protein